VNDVVSHNGSSWIAIAPAAAGDEPGLAPAKWQKMVDKGTDGANGTNGTNGADGAPGAPGTFSTANVTVRPQTLTNVTSGSAPCNAGEKALGGGWTIGSGGNIRAIQDQPTVSGTTPTGWTVTFSATMSGTVYAICVS
jgi:hypothetical protein